MSNEPQTVYVAESLYGRSVGGVFSTKEAADEFCTESRKIRKMYDFVTHEYVVDAKVGWKAAQYWQYNGEIDHEPAIEDISSDYLDGSEVSQIKNYAWGVAEKFVNSYSLTSAEDCLQKAIRLRNKYWATNPLNAEVLLNDEHNR